MIAPSLLGLALATAPLELRGVDVSSLARGEEHGAVYRDARGRPVDALAVLRDHGVNAVRLRVWVDPAGGVNRIDHMLPLARRAQELGLAVLVDLHYSDTWADPGRQDKPAAWRKLSFDPLKSAVAAHTRAVLDSLRAAGVTPRIVQVGNEIDDGLLWPDGRAKTAMARTAELVAAGAAAARASSPGTMVMVHVTARDTTAARWLLDGLRDHGVRWDVTGISYYAAWHGGIDRLEAMIDMAARRYQKPVVVVETAHPFTLASADAQENQVHAAKQLPPGTEASPAGQAAHLQRVIDALHRVPDGRGMGFFWWEGTWIATPGNGWDPRDPTSGNGVENQALFDFEGRPLPALLLLRP